MKLYASLTSPYARKVRIVFAEKRIECALVEASPWDADSPIPQFNPLGKVPVLVFDDGTSLFDSRVIVEYLDSVSPVSRLLPEGNRPRIAVRRWEALADGILDAASAIVIERRRATSRQNDEWIRRQRNKMELGVAMLARDLEDSPWCWSEGFSLADIATGVALGFLDLRFPDFDWRKEYPNLARHQEKLAKRQSFIDTLPSSS